MQWLNNGARVQKVKRWESKKYRQWITGLPSVHSMGEGCDAHHLINVLPSTGIGTKCHDLFLMPLLRKEHTDLHLMGGKRWDEYSGTRQSDEVLRTINKAINEGIIEIKYIGD